MKHAKKSKRKANDFYPTPQWCTAILAKFLVEVQVRNVVPDLVCICDVGAGDGRIGVTSATAFKASRKQLVCIDIKNPPSSKLSKHWITSDFLQVNLSTLFSNNTALKVYVSNPPYSLSNEIVIKTIKHMLARDHTAIAAFLLRINWLGSKARYTFLKEHPPRKMIAMSPRPSFTGKGTDMTEYAWFVWATPSLKVGKPIVVANKLEVT